ncbi:MAG: hypothetical protein EXR69_01360 [Myxococcales bacterium]|nr:hypothetical protein [Myxococcales bacterium]
MIALAPVLLDKSGYVDGVVVAGPAQDVWPGADRRARGIHALAAGKALSDEAAHRILRATLVFLELQVERTCNFRQMARLFSLAMGDGDPDSSRFSR